MFPIFMLVMACGLAADPLAPPKLNMQQLNELVQVRHEMEAIETLSKGEYFNRNYGDRKIDADLFREESRHKAKIYWWDGHSPLPLPTYEDVVRATGGDKPVQTSWQKVAGFLTFVHILEITGAILGIIACIWLFGLYFVGLCLAIPKEAWEILLYMICCTLVALGLKMPEGFEMYTVLPGCLGMVGCLQFSGYVHHRNNPQIAAWFLFVWWAAVAMCFGSHIIGFFAIMALLTAVGFIFGEAPGVIWVGFDSEDYVAQGTLSAGMLLGLYIIMSIGGITNRYVDVFREGISFLGTFVYFLGLLILSSKWYGDSYNRLGLRYWIMQIVTIVSGGLALWLGSVYGLGFLLGVGGTFFYIYLIEKYYEFPWKSAGWAWSLLGLAGILYGFAAFAQSHPQYFLFMTR